MTRKLMLLFAGLLALDAMLARLASAAGGKASDLVIVADTRVLDNPILLYFANLYNTNIVLFAVWTVVLTAAYGCLLGVLMDKLMGMTGLDLTSRKIVEH
ncbi:DVU0150 family protein [Desulfocurvus vexinensis]|uniref:DVU0150 family protein n=1 Tax=Desulfocurvus vexinensis TaxID=399548 RepID=UPI00048BE9E3|nr:DVU0150 family protein [Desulfocurvus vexinensis]